MAAIEVLPLFPLQLVLFPGEYLKLHIFEPRYKQLMADCLEGKTAFGIPCYHDQRVAEFGTEAEVTDVYRTYDNGEMDIRVRGRRVFHLDRFFRQLPGKLYSGGEVSWVADAPLEATGMEDEIWERFERLHALLGLGHRRERSAEGSLAFAIGHELGLNLPAKLELLAETSEPARQRQLLSHLKAACAMLEALAETKQRIQGNGQFHRFPTVEL